MLRKLLLTFILFCSACFAPVLKPPRGTVLSHSSLTRDIVGGWLMNEGTGNTVSDLSGNGHLGTLINSPNWVSCKYGPALDSNSGTGYIQLSSSVNLGTGAFTVVFSFNANTVSGTDYIFGNIYTAGNYCRAYFQSGNLNIYANENVKIWAGSSILIAGQHTYVITFDGTAGSGGAYRDGVLITGNSESNTGNVVIKQILDRGDGGGVGMDGVLDYFYVFNRVLPVSEIARIYREPFYFSRLQNPMLAMGDVGAAPPPTGQVIIIQSAIPFLLIGLIVCAFFVRDKR